MIFSAIRRMTLMLIVALAATQASLAETHLLNQSANAVMKNSEGETLGNVNLQQTPNGVLLRGQLANIPEGRHAVHIHETGKCDPQTGFKSAGGHLANGKQHGFHVSGGPHPGDMSNFYATQDELLRIEEFNSRVSLDKESAVFDVDGSALVVHAGADDYRSQPSGAAGDRIACGVIKVSQ